MWTHLAFAAFLTAPLAFVPTAGAQTVGVTTGMQSLTVSGGVGLRPTRAALGTRYGYFFTPRFEAGPSVGGGYQRFRGEGEWFGSIGGSARYWVAPPGGGFAPFVGAAADAVFITGPDNDLALFEANAGLRSRVGRGLALTPTVFVQVTEFGDVSQGVRLGACAFF